MRKDDNAALQSFLEATRIEPQFWPAGKIVGIALGNLGPNREAMEQFEIYLRGNPQDKDVPAVMATSRAGAPGR